MKRVQRIWIKSVPFENRARELTLQCRKTKTISSITLENKPNQPIAESADAVVKNYGMAQTENRPNSEFRSEKSDRTPHYFCILTFYF